jgi:hypothetical protein
MITVVIGIVFLTNFPNEVANPVSLLKFRYFTEREALILSERVLRDDPSKRQVRTHVTWDEFRSTVSAMLSTGLRCLDQY